MCDQTAAVPASNPCSELHEVGETGPCSPCSELHYDHSHSFDASRLVDAHIPQVIELWNIVFMQYDSVQMWCC
ncbi:hypothetical protein LSAT2_027103 [Lamellibrachia satsuma]|nr:hypothetical protein LSAT2_027103 [Lamellibrachia satsuma]